MTTIAHQVIGGVDTHKDIHVAAVVDELGHCWRRSRSRPPAAAIDGSTPGFAPTATSPPSVSRGAARGALASPATSLLERCVWSR